MEQLIITINLFRVNNDHGLNLVVIANQPCGDELFELVRKLVYRTDGSYLCSFNENGQGIVEGCVHAGISPSRHLLTERLQMLIDKGFADEATVTGGDNHIHGRLVLDPVHLLVN